MPHFLARLLGLGAYGACAGIVGLYLVVAFISRQTTTGGMDATLSHVVWIALGGLTLGLVVAHHVLGRQLLTLAREGGKPQPLGAE